MTPATRLTRAAVRMALEGVLDPCAAAAGLDLSVMDIGLVYRVAVDAGRVEVDLTFTELSCQFTHRVVSDIIEAIRALEGVRDVHVVPRWDPPWTPDRLSARAAAALAESRRGYPVAPGTRSVLLLPVHSSSRRGEGQQSSADVPDTPGRGSMSR